MKIGHVLRATRIDHPERFRLADCDTAHTHGVDCDKDAAKQHLADDVERLRDLQERLYAQDRWAVLVILQGMDASGKDGIIKHVMAGINPQGCEVHSFKQPSAEELDHDFLWRCAQRVPARGRIGIFNRSYYEEVLISRVHPDLIEQQHLPKRLVNGHLWHDRFEDIKAIERYLTRNGTVIRKIFLNVSRTEQRRRFLERLHDPAKKWKFSVNDVNERLRWKEYMASYEKAMCATSTAEAPWYIVPADHKWFTRLAVAEIVLETLESLELHVPVLSRRDHRALRHAKRRLRAR
jgi:PPK2 family polyphosphate:nucleotide phosphotransferase